MRCPSDILHERTESENTSLGNPTRFIHQWQRCTFLTTKADTAADVIDALGVQVIDLPRGPEYEGPPALYDSLLTGIVEQSHR